MTQSSRKRGFTLLELIVLLAIVSILIALVLPAVELARASARKRQCSHNIRQLAWAAHFYADEFAGSLPGTAVPRRVSPSGVPQGGWPWHAALLPYVEETSLYNAINWSFASSDRRVNGTAVGTKVDVFVCPSDYGGRSSYAVNAGSWYDYDYAATSRGRHDGFNAHDLQSITVRGRRVATVVGPNIDAIPDGTSNTVLFAEQIHSPSVSGVGPLVSQTLLDPGMELRLLSPDQARQICLSKGDDPAKHAFVHPRSRSSSKTVGQTMRPFPAVGEHWALPVPNRSTHVNGLLPPNTVNCLSRHYGSKNGRDGYFGLRTASSWHKGGVNLAFADGSVRFIRDDVDPRKYTAMFSIDRGEVTSRGCCASRQTRCEF